MKKEKTICWLLKIDKTQDIKFCKKYKNTNELSIVENKTIIDKLINEGVNKICWIADEALYYSSFLELLQYAKQKNIKCELFLNNLFNSDMRLLNKVIGYIDVLTVNIDLITYEKSLEFYKYLTDFFYYYQNKVQINVFSMVTHRMVEYSDSNIMELSQFKIDTWIILGFMPILLDETINVNEYYISKIDYKEFYYSVDFFRLKNIEHFLSLTEYSISRYFNIILSNADIAVMNEKDSIIIGNILKDNKEKIDKNYKNKKRFIIPTKKEQKVNVLIASSNNKLNNVIKTQIETLKYVNIVGITKNGMDTYKTILDKKPEMVFLQYNFKDFKGYDMILDLAKKMKLKLPVFNIIANYITDGELMGMLIATNSRINTWIRLGDYEERYVDILKDYKKYRDTD